MKDAALMGVVMQEKPKEEQCEVFDSNWEIVMMFIRLQTQWTTSMNGVIGLKYEVLEWLCRIYLIEDQTSMLEGIQVMEAAALKILNKQD